LARLLPTLLVLALVAATAAAFAVAERLKLERPPIAAPRIDKVFSPVCRCPTDDATIAFRLRRSDTVRLAIVDDELRVVRRLLESTRVPAGAFETSWDGRDDDGALVPDGSYRPRLHLASDRRTIVLPNPIRVDTRPPRLRGVGARPARFSPDGDGRRDKVEVFYRLNERARALLYLGDRRLVRTRHRPLRGKVEWFGLVHGRPLRAGRYRLDLEAEDPAGNRSEPIAVTVRIRYVELGRAAIRVRARTRFGVRVRTDAERFRWRFAGGTGTARPGLLVLRAPRAGRYTLFVEANGHGARAPVVVRPRLPRS
jgi:hypothetical protein